MRIAGCLLGMALGCAACGGSQPVAQHPSGSGDTVAANSAFEGSTPDPTPTAKPAADPQTADTTPSTPGQRPVPLQTQQDPSDGSATAPEVPTAPAVGNGGSGARVSKAQCQQAFDKYLDLALAENGMSNVPKELLDQVKQQAAQQAQGGTPCDSQPPRQSQYKCAMKATTRAAWETCMK